MAFHCRQYGTTGAGPKLCSTGADADVFHMNVEWMYADADMDVRGCGQGRDVRGRGQGQGCTRMQTGMYERADRNRDVGGLLQDVQGCGQ